MVVLLINIRNSENPVLPLGLLYIGTILKNHNINVIIEDIVFEKDENILYDKLKIIQPDIIGISFLTTAFLKAKRIVLSIKNTYKNKTIFVGGGIHCTAEPEETLNELGLDFIIRGEGEVSFLEFCKNILNINKNYESISGLVFKINSQVIINPIKYFIENLDDIPIPDWTLVNMKRYLIPPGYIKGIFLEKTLPILTSRGCPAKCIFCSSHTSFGYKIRRRSIENVVEEIKIAKKNYELDGLFFLDDTFTFDLEWVINFCNRLVEEKINLPWSCQTRVNVVTKDLIKTMKKAGCIQLDYGIESGSDVILNKLKKGITVEQIKNAFKITKDLGLRTYGSVLLGNPGESWDDIELTKKLVKEIKPSLTLFNFLTPFPGSELYNTVIKKGLLKDKKILYEYDTRRADMPIFSDTLSFEELRKARSELQNLVFFNNYKNYFNYKNIRFIYEMLGLCIKNPINIIRGIKKAIKNKTMDDFVDTIYYLYCQNKSA